MIESYATARAVTALSTCAPCVYHAPHRSERLADNRTHIAGTMPVFELQLNPDGEVWQTVFSNAPKNPGDRPMPLEMRSIMNMWHDVRHRVIGDEGVVFLQDSAEVVVVNENGARVLQLIDGKRSVEQMLDRLIVEYDVERSQIEADVPVFAQQTVDAGIVAS